MKASELSFEEINGAAPVLTCNACGNVGIAATWRVATVPISEGRTAAIVVCSPECERIIKSSPATDSFVNDLIRRIEAKIHSADR